MNIRRNTFCAFTLLICLIYYSCRSKTYEYAQQDKKYHINLPLVTGSKYYYTVSNETEMNVEVNDKEIKNVNKSEIGLIYQVQKDSAGATLLQITYDKFHIVTKSKDNEQIVNVTRTSASFNPVEKLLSNIIGSSIYVTLNKEREIINITGNTEISGKILAAMGSEDAYTKRKIEEQISKLVGETFVKNNIEQGFKLFPDDTSIMIGDSWSRTMLQSSDLKLDAVTNYTLVSVSDDVAKLESNAKIQTHNSTADMMGYQVLTNLKGTETGEFETEISSGFVLRSKSDATIQGTIEIIGKEVPVKIIMTKHITGKKV